MIERPRINRSSSIVADEIAQLKLLLEQARELLKLPLPDTFLGRRTGVPFPMQDDIDPAEPEKK